MVWSARPNNAGTGPGEGRDGSAQGSRTAETPAMMARTGQCLTDLGTAALALLDLRHMLREGVLARVHQCPAVEQVLVPGREADIAADLYLPGARDACGGLVLVP